MENNWEEEVMATSLKVIERVKEIEKHQGWKANGVKPCEMFKMQIDGRVACKGIAVVNYSLDKVFTFMEKEESLLKLNPMLLETKVLYAKENEYRVNYMRYKGIWPVSERDFVNVSRKSEEGDKIFIGTTACSYPHPEVNKVVRGAIYIGAYILEKVDANKTRVTYISDADLKGNIPGMVKNTLSARQGEVASKIEDAMKKDGY